MNYKCKQGIQWLIRLLGYEWLLNKQRNHSLAIIFTKNNVEYEWLPYDGGTKYIHKTGHPVHVIKDDRRGIKRCGKRREGKTDSPNARLKADGPPTNISLKRTTPLRVRGPSRSQLTKLPVIFDDSPVLILECHPVAVVDTVAFMAFFSLALPLVLSPILVIFAASCPKTDHNIFTCCFFQISHFPLRSFHFVMPVLANPAGTCARLGPTGTSRLNMASVRSGYVWLGTNKEL